MTGQEIDLINKRVARQNKYSGRKGIQEASNPGSCVPEDRMTEISDILPAAKTCGMKKELLTT